MLILVYGELSHMVVRAEPAQGAVLSDAQHDKILKYLRERFGVPDTVKLTLGPLLPSPVVPGFNQAAVMVADGKNQKSQPVLVSRDARFLVVVTGSIVDLPQDTPAEIAQRFHETYKTPDTLKLTVGASKPSASPAFNEAVLTMDDGKNKQDRTLLITHDGKHMILSDLYPLGVDPRQLALHNMALTGEPSVGPPNAPVTLVEYADLQCPTCARMHDFLETKLIPRYGNKLHVVFKEYPLPMHDWSFTAAIADQCAYEINPSSYVPLRTLIFQNQQLINIANLRDTLLNFGEQSGVDRVKLAGCLDSKASLSRIQRDMAEAKRINVASTPTVFINGRMIVGLPSEDAYYQAIDAALQGK